MSRKVVRIAQYSLIFIMISVWAATAYAGAVPQPLTLRDALRIASEQNLQRQLAVGEVNVAQTKVSQAMSGYYPKVTLNGGATQFNETPTSVQLGTKIADLNNALDQLAGILQAHNPTDPYYAAFAAALSQREHPDQSTLYYGLKLNIEQPLYTGNKLTALNKQAGANLQYANANLETMEQTIVCDVKKAYYTVLYVQQMQVTMQEAVRDMEKHVQEANTYYKAGLVPKLDVMRAEVKLADLKQKQMLAENSLSLAKSTLVYILGVAPDTEYQLVDELKFQPVSVDLATCQTKALQNRPELKALTAKEEMARQAVAIAKSGGRPVVALRADGEDTKPYNSGPSVSVSLVASVRVFDGGMTKNQVAEAEANLKQVQTARQWVERGVRLEVEQAYRNLQVAVATLQVAEQSLAQAQEIVKMATVSYQAGLSTSLERIDAEVGLTQAKTNYNQASSMYNIALAQLYKAMGEKGEK